jgi:hypothetical protein
MPKLRSTFLLPFLINCVGDPSTDDLADTDQPLQGASAASQFQRVRAVSLSAGFQVEPTCTATKIARNYILTGGQCAWPVGSKVGFYGLNGPGVDTALVTARFEPPGAHAQSGDLSADNGLFSDIAIYQLDRADLIDTSATLAWTYPGSTAAGVKVGAGEHDNLPNPYATLRQLADWTSSSDDVDGLFHTWYREYNDGDEGGPFYYQGRVLGVLDGDGLGTGARYTSVPRHLDWILSTINYHWSGAPPTFRQYSGTPLETIANTTERICQYACESRSDCEAYNIDVPSPTNTSFDCQLVGGVTSSFQSNGHGALRHAGPKASRSGDVVGYLRGDDWNSVIHKSFTAPQHVHELYYQSGTSWNWGDLSAARWINDPPGVSTPAPTPSGKFSAYRRADGVNAIVYRSGGSLIEIALTDTWRWYFLPLRPQTTPLGDPAAYVRADGVSAVLYRTSTSHIIELALVGAPAAATQGWASDDLNNSAGGAPIADGEPTGFVRSDGYSSVLYRSGTQVTELYQNVSNHVWNWGQPTGLVTCGGVPCAAPPVANKATGFLHPNGMVALVYRATTGHVIELFIDPQLGWQQKDLTSGMLDGRPLAAGDPTGYVRFDGVVSVVYRAATTNEIWELTNTTAQFQAWNLNASVPHKIVPWALSEPMPYLRRDGKNAIVYNSSGTRASELSEAPSGAWDYKDLSIDSGENL